MRTWVVRARRMTPSDYIVAIEVLLLAVWIEVAIGVMPFSRLLDRAKRASRRARGASDSWLEHQRLSRFVAVAYDILPFPATCLRQSLVLHTLLGRRGVPSRFCVGVAKNGPALTAHAWIECDGIALDTHASAFRELHP